LSELLDFGKLGLGGSLAVFALGAAVILVVGARTARLVDRLARHTGMGRGFAGMLFLGGIVSLTEISTVSTASLAGSPRLALNNLFGNVSMNLFLLAVVDCIAGRGAITSFIIHPAMLLQGTLAIVLLSFATMAMTIGDYPVLGVGLWSSALFLLCLGALWMSAVYDRRQVWVARGGPEDGHRAGAVDQARDADASPGPGGEKLWPLALRLLGCGLLILAAGFALAKSGDSLAEQTGLGTSFVGFFLVGMSTSLPELSTTIPAIRMKRHEMAIGEILGSNLFSLLLIFLADVVYDGGPVLNQVGGFEVLAALLGITMTGILLVGMLERRDRSFLRMGYDSIAILVLFAAGAIALYRLSGTS